MPAISQVTLRRLAARALRVLERHKQREPAIGALVGSLDVDAKAFIDAYDAVMSGSPARRFGSTSGSAQIEALVKKQRMWLALLTKDVPQFKRAEYLKNTAVADDVIASAQQLLGAVEDYNATAPEPLAYAEDLSTDLETALSELQQMVGARNDARADHTELLATARRSADAFYRELIALRSTLSAAVGRSHPDYRLLRNPSGQSGDGEEDTVADDLEEAAGLSGAGMRAEVAVDGEANTDDAAAAP